MEEHKLALAYMGKVMRLVDKATRFSNTQSEVSIRDATHELHKKMKEEWGDDGER